MSQIAEVPNKKLKLTHKQIDALTPHNKNSASAMTEYSTEIPNLKLAVGSSSKYWWYRYRFRGEKRMLRLGTYPSMGIIEAQQLAHQARNMLDRGLDPADERNRRRNMPILNDFITTDYLPWARINKRSYKDDEARCKREIGQMLGNIPLNEITARDVMMVHSAVYKRSSAATANRYLALTSKIFSHAILSEYIDRNPVKGVKKYREAGPRLRFLSGEELNQFLHALKSEKQTVPVRAIKCAIFTGLRSKSEVFSLRWSSVDFESGTVRLLHTKNGRTRTVALNSPALELLKEMRSQAKPECPWVFPARCGSGHLVDVRKPLQKILNKAGISDLTPHDLRRTFGSLAVNAGVDIYQVKDLLGHSNVTVTQRVYSHLLQGTLRQSSEIVGRSLQDAICSADREMVKENSYSSAL
ncbi:putative prophage CPZ-55 integrase [Geobacter sp. OR-1]|uniref:tyrosine-type recombinase/integrase n=1 Tax=Geobacter sp. OR-1 TaxID=1266765 RepID=UPI000543FDB8|nr:site-specific integrase [Geobacter sp. OR-1]GAM11729.1 putative prophage CPZ-55 integrase [Geobacter sp. OR-1]